MVKSVMTVLYLIPDAYRQIKTSIGTKGKFSLVMDLIASDAYRSGIALGIYTSDAGSFHDLRAFGK